MEDQSKELATKGENDEKKDILPSVDSTQLVGSTRWLKLETLTYRSQDGVERKWDMATRTTKKSWKNADAVIIIPLLHYKDRDTVETLLVHQFRPPVRQETVEFPAGLIDAGESPLDAALRELKEETGYIGNRSKSEVLPKQVCMSPGLTDESVVVTMIHVDMPQTPEAENEESEFITVQKVPFDQALTTLLSQSASMPIMGLYLFSLGYQLGHKIGQQQGSQV